METPETLHQRVRREQQMMARLRLAMTRLADAERERIWAIVAAKEAGLSIRQIARATGVSPTRIHQLLQADAAHAIPVWLSQLPEHALELPPEVGSPPPSPADWRHLADDANAPEWKPYASTRDLGEAQVILELVNRVVKHPECFPLDERQRPLIASV